MNPPSHYPEDGLHTKTKLYSRLMFAFLRPAVLQAILSPLRQITR